MNEIRRLIREALSSEEDTYLTEDVPLSLNLNNILGPDDYFDESKASIEWSLYTDEKSYGIRTIKPMIHKIILKSKIWREDTEELDEFEKVYDFEHGIVDGGVFEEFKINIEKNNNADSFFPTEISIYEDYNSIDIEFQYP